MTAGPVRACCVEVNFLYYFSIISRLLPFCITLEISDAIDRPQVVSISPVIMALIP